MKKILDLPKVKADLNSVSPTFCIAKWKQVTLHLHNGRTHSCHHPYPHPIPLNEIQADPSALHNTQHKIRQRELMLNGKRPPECQYCWNVEDLEGFKNNSIFSDRITKSSESWALPFLQEAAQSKTNVNPSYVEVSFSNLCNFKCSYCSPIYSSKWQEEVETHGPYRTSAKFNNLEYFKSIGEMPLSAKQPNPYVEAFWKWWPDLIKDLHVFRITGGEPLLNDNTYKILDYLSDNPKPNLKLAVNTNGNAPQKLMDEFIQKTGALLNQKKIEGLHIFTSLDGYGSYAEYGRHGLNYSAWLKNANKILSEIPETQLTIMCTTNIFSIPEFHKFLEMILELKTLYPGHRVTSDINILRFPHHQNLSIVTDELKSSFDSCLEFLKKNPTNLDLSIPVPGFSVFEINRLERLIEYVKSGPNKKESISLKHARKDFYTFVTEHDRRRGTDFVKTFPQLNDFYSICKNSG